LHDTSFNMGGVLVRLMHLKDWLASEEVQRIRRMSWKDILEKEFNRNPIRPIKYSPTAFYAPNDGVVLHTKVVKSDEEYINVKGRKLTVQDLLQDKKYNEESLVIGIFLTVYDMHYSRMPTDAIIRCTWKEVEGISSGMFNLERLIIGKGTIDVNLEDYLFSNERWVFECANLRHDFKYYIVQVADVDVNIILPYIKDKWTFKRQGETFSFVTYGSHTEIIIPIKYAPKLLIPQDDIYHVSTSDVLVEFGGKEGAQAQSVRNKDKKSSKSCNS